MIEKNVNENINCKIEGMKNHTIMLVIPTYDVIIITNNNSIYHILNSFKNHYKTKVLSKTFSTN